MENISERLDALSVEKRALLQHYLKKNSSENGAVLPLTPQIYDESSPLTLSFSQRRLWFLHQLDPASTAYNTFACLRLEGKLDEAALEQTFDEIIRRHKVLRTTFTVLEDTPVGYLNESIKADLNRIDLENINPSKRLAEALNLATEEIRKPFDLENGPVIRTTLIKLDPEDHILVLTIHHIASDRWSVDILMNEVGILYESYSQKKPSPLYEIKVQYADFAVWQKKLFDLGMLSEQMNYWRKQLEKVSPQLNIPTDFSKSSSDGIKGGRKTLKLEKALVKKITKFCEQEEVTAFMLMLTVFKMLLFRYGGDREITIGSPIANRPRIETQKLIGFFLNTLVLKTEISGNLTFRENLKKVKQVCLEAYANQDLPFEKIVEELSPDRNSDSNPMFQVMFTLNDIHDPSGGKKQLEKVLGTTALKMTPLNLDTGGIQANLILHIEYRGENTVCALDYRKDLYKENRIRRMLDHFARLLEAVLSNPDAPLVELDYLSEDERHLVLSAWNQTARRFAAGQSALTMIRQQAQNNPTATAIITRQSRISYAQMWESAAAVGAWLGRRGVKRGDIVAVQGERGAQLIIWMLGIWAAGAAYLPLESAGDQAPERQRRIVEDSGACWQAEVVSETEAVTRVTRIGQRRNPTAPERYEVRIAEGRVIGGESAEAEIESRGGQTAAEQTGATADEVGGEDLAYIIYTSGSTGHPKGVCVPHKAICRLILNTDYIQIKSSDRVAHLSNPSFDAATFEIWGALLEGAAIVIFEKDVALHPAQLKREIEANKIDVIFLTTALFNQIVQAEPEIFKDVRNVLFGGEAVDIQKVREFFAYRPPERLLHVYGPTENTTFSTWYEIKKISDDDKTIPIGKSISNSKSYILDQYLRPAAIGEIGELCLGGDGLAAGYLGLPDLTAEKFIPNPYAEHPGERIYRTGDRCRWLEDGSIEFVGRTDNQVKIRGLRIELDEIQAIIAKHSKVSEVVLTVKTDTVGEKRLIAFLTVNPSETTTEEEIKRFLNNYLPQYMIPASIIILEKLPLNKNGKVDKNALSLIAPQIKSSDAPIRSPRTPVEETLLEIVRQLLGVKNVTTDANFFAIGGHSLLATQLVSAILKTFEVQISLKQLYEATDFAELAEMISNASSIHSNNSDAVYEIGEIVSDRDNRHKPFPLTDVQQAYWLGRSNNFDFGNVSAHGYLELSVRHLDVKRLENSLQNVIERHDMLKTVFLPEGRQQVLSDTPVYRIPVTDLRSLQGEAQENRIGSIREEMSHQILQSDKFPLFDIRATLLSEEISRLHISTDALIGDAWSWQILSKEIEEFYSESDKQMPPLEITFRDYVLAENALKETESYKKALTYWQKKLDDFPGAPDLPVSRSAQVSQTRKFKRRHCQLEKELWESLKKRGMNQGVTPSCLILAIFSEVLAMWSKTERYTVNLTLFNRLPVHRQVGQIVGDFTSLTLLAIDHRAAETFKQRARQIQKQLLEDLEHRSVSGIRVMRELAQRTARGIPPAMPIVFTSLLNFSSNAPRESAIKGELVYSISQTPQVWLDHQVYERDGTLKINWDVLDEMFDEGVIDDMFEAFEKLLRELALNAGSWNFTTFDILPQKQKLEFLAYNATGETIPDKLLHTLFFEKAERNKDKTAIAAPDKTLTYRELFNRSLQLAGQIRANGTPSGQLVGIFMAKGWEQIVAAVGILAAGAAYLPIDIELPPERIKYILKNAEIKQIILQSSGKKSFDWEAGIKCIEIDRDSDAPNADWTEWKKFAGGSVTDLAYVIYTSGSTGVPKGVMIDHRGAVNTVLDINERFGIDSNARVFALSKMNFDLSVYDIFGTLAAGGTIVLPAESSTPDPDSWLQTVREEQVTVWNSVPALMLLLVEHLAGKNEKLPASLKKVLLSGDWIPLTLPDKIREQGNDVEVISLGGATEASIWSIFHPVKDISENWTSIPYGRPLTNQTIYIFNHQLTQRPFWVTGEICIGGIGVALGYLGDGQKTAEKFIVHPATGERIYKTGDLGRYLPDGFVEFLGREDFQVKIQGHRIELGEIESVLSQHPFVKSSLASVWQPTQADKRLLAYVVLKEDQELMEGELKEFLRNHLPEYMIPSRCVFIDSFPLTANGKIDRKNLPAPERIYESEEEKTEQILTQTQEMLSYLWANVLKVPQVGLYEDFFNLGGHSMLAAEIVAEIRKTWAIDIPLRKIFEFATIAELSLLIDSVKSQKQDLNSFFITGEPRTDIIPLSFAQQRLWFLDRLIPNSSAYNMPFAARLKGDLDYQALRKSFDEIAARHEILRTTFEEFNGIPRQIIHEAKPVELEFIDLTHLDEEKRSLKIQQFIDDESVIPFDLTKGGLFLAKLIDCGNDEHLLLITMHHIVSDGWSLGLLVKELDHYYQAFLTGNKVSLPELKIQYADYAIWQRKWLTREFLEKEMNYWLDKLKNAPPVHQLPLDHPRPAVQTFQGDYVNVELSAELTSKIKDLSRAQRATFFMVLLAAFKVLIFRLSGQTDILVGAPVANRLQPEIAGLIGFFANTTVLRTEFEGNETFEQFLQYVRETALESYSHQDLPFEQLVEKVNPARSLSYTPLFQIMFALQNAPMAETQLSSLKLLAVESQTKRVHFDLTLRLWEQDDKTVGRFEYNADIFTENSVAGFADHFIRLCENIVSNPRNKISELQILSETERNAVLYQWNSHILPAARNLNAVELFEQQAAQNPHKICLKYAGEEFTFAALNRQANRLASYLLDKGIARETPVAICFERSPGFLISILAVLKAGAAWIPLDPKQPDERLVSILSDCRADILISQSDFKNRFSNTVAEIITPDSEAEIISEYDAGNPNVPVDRENLAYIIYTSGTTGKPKGVMITHGNLINYCDSLNDRIQIKSDDVYLHTASFGFSSSVRQMFLPLSAGAAVVLTGSEDTGDARKLFGLIKKHEVTVIDIVPSFGRILISELKKYPENEKFLLCQSLRSVLFASETLTTDIADLWKGEFDSQIDLVNMLGQTETSGIAAVYHINEIDHSKNSIPVGKPLTGTATYLLSENLEPVPVGTIGEIYIDGSGLGRGYLNRPVQTAATFIPDPFSPLPGARMIKTGDLGRLGSDGNLEFLQRKDDQVKIRGFRVEPGEIESAIRKFSGIKDVVILPRRDETDSQSLAAYLIFEDQAEASLSDLLIFLQSKLPDYMIPKTFLSLDDFPLTATGKIDRRMLSAKSLEEINIESELTPPRNEIEESLINIWKEVLFKTELGIHDNFFNLGGHSLIATQVISRIRDVFQLELSLRDFFEQPTVATLGNIIRRRHQDQSLLKSKIPLADRNESVPVSFSQQRLWFMQLLEPQSPAYSVPSLVKLKGNLDIPALEKSLRNSDSETRNSENRISNLRRTTDTNGQAVYGY